MATRKLPGTASTKDAGNKTASGNKPASENTTGIITPQTSPNVPGAPTNPPVKPETPQEKGLLEKAGELLEKGEIGVLNQAKDAVSGGIDTAVQAAGGGWLAQGIGAIAKGANEILFPTNVIDLIPGGKILSGGKKAVKLGEKALAKVGKEATKETTEAAAKGAAKKETKEAAEKGVKNANSNGGGISDGKKKKKRKDPCKHPNDSKKKKYVVYRADEFDANGKKIGTYVGRTSGEQGEDTMKILRRRQSSHHRNKNGNSIGDLEGIFETDSYAGVRGAEQILRDKYSTTDQINPISPKNKRKDDYMDCAKTKGAK